MADERDPGLHEWSCVAPVLKHDIDAFQSDLDAGHHHHASAPSPATAAATTANDVGTNSPSPTTPTTSAIAVSRRPAIPLVVAKKVFDGMPCKPAARVLHVTGAKLTADKNDYMRALLRIRDHRIDKVVVKQLKHIKRKAAASSAQTTTPTTPAAAPTIRLAAPPTAPVSTHAQASPIAKDGIPSATPTSTPTLAAPGAEDENLSNSPTRCSTQCLNRDTTPALCSAAFPLGVHKTCTLESKAIRYITSCYRPHLIGVVPVGVATDVLEDCMILDIKIEPNPAIPWSSPGQDSNTLLSETTCLCFTFWLPFSCGSAGVQKKPPWPPPVQLER